MSLYIYAFVIYICSLYVSCYVLFCVMLYLYVHMSRYWLTEICK